MTKSNKMAVLRPLVSEIKLMIINPANEPIGKIDWIVNLAHCKSQYSPNSDVRVKSSTFHITKNYLSSTDQSFYMLISHELYVFLLINNEISDPCRCKGHTKR